MKKQRKRRMWIDQAPLASVTEPSENYSPYKVGCYEGWECHTDNPILHQNYENGQDPCVIKKDGIYYLYFTWSTMNRISLMQSTDLKLWRGPLINFLPQLDIPWEEKVSEPCIIYKDGRFEMWYTARTIERDTFQPGEGRIAHAVSEDGINWLREMEPVFKPELLWEEYCVSNPSVLYDQKEEKYRMWYAAGSYRLPHLIGYAESKDGLNWRRISDLPVLKSSPGNQWERIAVSKPSVVREGEYFHMIYCGFEHLTNSRLCYARSKDGINWQRHPNNPIITGGKQSWWDSDYTGSASIICEDDGTWRLFYTGGFHNMTNIGIMTNENKMPFRYEQGI